MCQCSVAWSTHRPRKPEPNPSGSRFAGSNPAAGVCRAVPEWTKGGESNPPVLRHSQVRILPALLRVNAAHRRLHRQMVDSNSQCRNSIRGSSSLMWWPLRRVRTGAMQWVRLNSVKGGMPTARWSAVMPESGRRDALGERVAAGSGGPKVQILLTACNEHNCYNRG